jgi:hypothetical protein
MAQPLPSGAPAWAAAWTAADFPVVPLLGKSPSCNGKDWMRKAITTPADVGKAFDGRNVGLLLTGLIDIDPDDPLARRLWDLWPHTNLAFCRGSLPKGEGTTHRFYGRHPDDAGIRNVSFHDYTKGRAKGKKILELRVSGQTMAPGSLHPDTHEPILLGGVFPPCRPPVTRWADLLRAGRLTAAVVNCAKLWPGEGRRNDFAVRLTGGLVYHGLGADDARLVVCRAALLANDEEWEKRGNEADVAADRLKAGEAVMGYTQLEAEFDLPYLGKHLCDTLGLKWRRPNTAGGHSVQPRDHASPRPKPKEPEPARPAAVKSKALLAGPRRLDIPADPYPVDALPPVAREFVLAVARDMNVAAPMVALPVIAALAGAIGGRYSVTLDGAWTEPCILWTTTIAETGARKSPPWKAATQRLMDHHTDARMAFRSATQADQEAETDWRKLAKEADVPPPRPCATAVNRHVVTTDATIEGLCRALPDNPAGIVVACEELDTFWQGFTRYGSSSSLGHWLRLYDGGSLAILRADSAREVFCPRAVASITGTTQPDIYKEVVTTRNVASGMLGRFWAALMEPTRNILVRNPGYPVQQVEYDRLIDALLAMTPGEAGRPHVLRFGDAAYACYEEWHNAHAESVFNAAHGPVKASGAKLWGQVIRYALVYHLCAAVVRGFDPRAPICLEAVQAAVAVGRWQDREHGRLYPAMGVGCADGDGLESRVLRYLRRHTDVCGIDVRGLTRALKDRSGTVTALAVLAAVETLAGEGYGKLTTSTSPSSAWFEPGEIVYRSPEDLEDDDDVPA